MPSVSQWLGLEADPVSTREKVVSAIGGLIALIGMLLVTEHVLGLAQSSALLGSMGASAVLLFGVPHGQLSQPWAVFGGHVVSALIGVTTAQTLGHGIVAAAVAVGVAIGAMHAVSCVHPPGGATALTAVVGGTAIHDLGYRFVLAPVVLNVVLMLVIAVAYNSLFPWRRYPRPPRPAAAPGQPSHAEVVAALRSLDSLIDVDEADLVKLVELLAPAASGGPVDRHPRGLTRSPRDHVRRLRDRRSPTPS